MKSTRLAEARWQDDRQRWFIRVQKDGHMKSFTSTTAGRKGKREVEQRADDWLECGTEDMRATQAWEIFIAEHSKRVSPPTAKQLRSAYDNHIRPAIGARKLSKVTPAIWQSMVDDLADRGYKIGTVRYVMNCVNCFQRCAHKHRWQVVDILPGEIELAGERAKPKSALTLAQLRDLFDDAHPTTYSTRWYRPVFRFLVATGLRRGELCALRRSDLVGDLLTVSRSRRADGSETDGKTANAHRTIRLSRQALDALNAHMAMRKERDKLSIYLFTDRFGDAIGCDNLSWSWKSYAERNGIECSIHGLRHTYISIVKADMPMPLLKQVVGHSAAMDTIGVYGHELSGDADRASNIATAALDHILTDTTTDT